MSKLNTLLEHLRANPGIWIHTDDLYGQIAGKRVAARIYDLKERGHNIESRPCPDGSGNREYKFILEN